MNDSFSDTEMLTDSESESDSSFPRNNSVYSNFLEYHSSVSSFSSSVETSSFDDNSSNSSSDDDGILELLNSTSGETPGGKLNILYPLGRFDID